MKNSIFFHIATVNHYQKIVDEIISGIFKSGLVNEIDHINIGIVGNGSVILPENKINILYKNGDLSLFEFPTLNFLKQFAKDNEDYNILYLHTKGTNLDTPPINDWRKYMLYFLVDKYKECFDVLKEYDSCGVDLRNKPTLHYSGNFWWSKSEYIKTLKEFKDMPIIIDDRHKSEFWICSGNGKHHSLWDCGIDVYQRHLHEYKENNYRK